MLRIDLPSWRVRCVVQTPSDEPSALYIKHCKSVMNEVKSRTSERQSWVVARTISLPQPRKHSARQLLLLCSKAESEIVTTRIRRTHWERERDSLNYAGRSPPLSITVLQFRACFQCSSGFQNSGYFTMLALQIGFACRALWFQALCLSPQSRWPEVGSGLDAGCNDMFPCVCRFQACVQRV